MKDDQVFEVGDGTVMKMKNQSFLTEEFGTVATDPGSTPVSLTIAAASETSGDTDLVRLQRQVDLLVRAIESLHRRVDSVDAAVARFVNR